MNHPVLSEQIYYIYYVLYIVGREVKWGKRSFTCYGGWEVWVHGDVATLYYVYANIAVSIFSVQSFETMHLSSSGGVQLNVTDIVCQDGFQFVLLSL